VRERCSFLTFRAEPFSSDSIWCPIQLLQGNRLIQIRLLPPLLHITPTHHCFASFILHILSIHVPFSDQEWKHG
jgi:hypothetical protein